MFSDRLNAIRKDRGYTARQMADILHVGIRNYRKYESGDAKPTLETLSVIADTLNVSVDDLLCRDTKSPEGAVCMIFCQKLREVRIHRSFTQQTVADALGISLRAYQYYEQGTREPSLQMLVDLSNFLNVSADYLLGRVSAFEDFSS